MELTIVQNGALYAIQHGATKMSGASSRKQASAPKVIRTAVSWLWTAAAQKITTKELCYT